MRRKRTQLNQLAIDKPIAICDDAATERDIGDVVYFAPYYFHVMQAKDKCKGCYWFLNDKCYITPSMSRLLGFCTAYNRDDNNNVIFKYLKYKNQDETN